MRVLTLLVSATLVWASRPVDFSSPKTIPSLWTRLGNLDHNVSASVAADLGRAHFNGSSSPCLTTCTVLGLLLKGKVVNEGSPAFPSENNYWSDQQEETTPACRINPSSAKDVAVALLVTGFLKCQFAVKSGGHAAFKGASNIQAGITIDLKNLNQVKVSANKTLTKTGAGNHWYDVYSKLDPQGLSVVGGRVAAIGVGGLTLGGGISFFSGRHGSACDGVRNYEVVLANGRILNVNQQSYPDLYFALRGGGNNFGVVTRFDLETFPQGDLWGGSTIYPVTANVSLYNAFDNFANNAPSDPDAALIVVCVYYQGNYLFVNDYEYAKPIANPPIFHDFTAIPPLSTTQRITNLTDLTLELNASAPSGFRQTYTTASFKTSAELQTRILELFVHEIETIKDAVGFLPALVMQPITKPMLSHFSKRGGNALGIAESDGPLIMFNLAFMWSSVADDERVIAASRRIRDGAVALARGMGLNFRYVYQNYASLDQDVFAGYGEANKRRLIEISKKYDPGQVFQKLQPGYFKLSGNNGGSPV